MKKLYKRHYKGTEEQILKRVEMYCKQYNLIYTDLIIHDNYVTFTGYSNISYEELVNKLVKERYSDSEEFAILRKALTEKTNEFYIYNSYVEDCKERAKAFIVERESVINGNK